MAARDNAREQVTALVLFVVLAFYCATIGWRGVLLVLDGRLVPVLLGIAVILLPLVTLAAVWRLVVFARDGSAMMKELHSGDRAAARRRGVARSPRAGRAAPPAQGPPGRAAGVPRRGARLAGRPLHLSAWTRAGRGADAS